MVYEFAKRVRNQMKIEDAVHLYEGEWYFEGRITAIDGESVTVDFIDWVQRYRPHELRVSYIHFQEVIIPIGPGECLQDFRD